MSFKYDANDAVSCLPPGDYMATIQSHEITTSKENKDPMLVIEFKVRRNDGSGYWTVYERIVNPPKNSGRKGNIFRLRDLAMALGKYEEFKLSRFDVEKYIGENVVVTLSIESSEKYGDQNRIKAFKPKDSKMAAPVQEDDELVPF